MNHDDELRPFSRGNGDVSPGWRTANKHDRPYRNPHSPGEHELGEPDWVPLQQKVHQDFRQEMESLEDAEMGPDNPAFRQHGSTDWTAALHQGAGMPAMQQPATIKDEQGGFKVSKPPAKVKAPPALKQPKPAVPLKPVKAAPAAKAGPKAARLAGVDQRWVDLESARFVAANTDTLDDSHELAVRAHDHAAAKTSTFPQRRSAAVCEAFVRSVTALGQRQHRPVHRTASLPNTDFPDSLMFL